MYEVQAIICDENMAPILPSIEDMLRLDVSGSTDSDGKMTLHLSLDYEQTLDALNILTPLDQQPVQMPQFIMYTLLKIKGQNCQWFVLGQQAYIIYRAERILSEDGSKIIELVGNDGNSLLKYRGIPFNSDQAQAQRNGIVSDVLAQVSTDAFGPGINAARDWIAAGTIALAIPAGIGAAGFNPKLNFKASLLSVFQEAIDFSTAQGIPLFFRVRPTIAAGLLGEVPQLPWIIEVALVLGQDRSAGQVVNNTVLLSVDNGMISSYSWGVDYTEDYSVSFVGGQGTGAARIVAPAGAPAINAPRVASTVRYGWKESVSSVTDLTTPAQAADRQTSDLEEGVSRSRITTGTALSSQFIFGRGPCGHFQSFDKVTVYNQRFKGGPFEQANVTVKSYLFSAFEGRQSLTLSLEPDRIFGP